MKKYFLLIILAISIGFFMGKSFLEQYDGYKGIRIASSTGDIVYFIKFGEFSSYEEMEKDTISLNNYIYNEVNGKFIVYIGITDSNSNLIKLTNYYNKLGYNTITEEYLVTNQQFLNVLNDYDAILESTDDEVVITSISSQILTKYEEYVNNGN